MRTILFVLLSLVFLNVVRSDCNAGCTDCQLAVFCNACDDGYSLYQGSCYPCPMGPFCGSCSVTPYSSSQVKIQCTAPSGLAIFCIIGVILLLLSCCYCCCCARRSSNQTITMPLYGQQQYNGNAPKVNSVSY